MIQVQDLSEHNGMCFNFDDAQEMEVLPNGDIILWSGRPGWTLSRRLVILRGFEKATVVRNPKI